jgi:hypothetical protein
MKAKFLGCRGIFLRQGCEFCSPIGFLSLKQNHQHLPGWPRIPDQPPVVLIILVGILTVLHFVPSQMFEHEANFHSVGIFPMERY